MSFNISSTSNYNSRVPHVHKVFNCLSRRAPQKAILSRFMRDTCMWLLSDQFTFFTCSIKLTKLSMMSKTIGVNLFWNWRLSNGKSWQEWWNKHQRFVKGCVLIGDKGAMFWRMSLALYFTGRNVVKTPGKRLEAECIGLGGWLHWPNLPTPSQVTGAAPVPPPSLLLVHQLQPESLCFRVWASCPSL